MVKLLLAPVSVQGLEAEKSIVDGIRRLDADPRPDIILITRGGGSKEDLWVFNSERIARAAYACKKPVVSAVGHEIDTTILDYVADLRAPTPSAAAELCVPDQAQVRHEIFILQQNIQKNIQSRLEMCYNKFNIISPAAAMQNEKTGIDEGHSFGLGHILVLLTLAATVVWVVWGVMTQGYYMPEIATQFFIMGIVSGVIGVIFKLNDMKLNDIATSFKDGAKDLIGAALVVAMAQGIMQVLGGSDPTTPTVINTIMYNISNALSGVSGAVAAVLMYLFQSVFNFFVVSGTGQAAITMPIMAPLSDLLGVSRQTAVVAFQLGDAFTNLIVPTSGCLIGSLAIAKIEWSNWIKFMWKFLGVLMIGAIITVLIAVGIGF